MKFTRAILDAIYNGELEQAETVEFPVFKLQIPKNVTGVQSEILNPENTAKDKAIYRASLVELSEKFNKNFEKYSALVSDEVRAAGPNADGHRA